MNKWNLLKEKELMARMYYIVCRPKAKSVDAMIGRAYWNGRNFIPSLFSKQAPVEYWMPQPRLPKGVYYEM